LGDAKLTGQGGHRATSENGTDEIPWPNNEGSPKTETVSFKGTNLKRSFPAHSFTVLRLKTK